jgi:hypothetical protein
MKKIFTSILTMVILSIAIVGCDKKDPNPKLDDEQEKATFVGYWEKTGITVDGYKGDKKESITDAEILAEVGREIPTYFEFTMTEMIFAEVGEAQSFTLDSKTSTMVFVDNEGHESNVKYELFKDNNTGTVIFIEEGESGSEYTTLHVTLKLKRIAKLPDEIVNNNEVRAALLGKWERQSFKIDIWKNGVFVEQITDPEELNEYGESREGLPHFFEFGNTSIYFADENKKRYQDYTIDAKSNTLTFIDDDYDGNETRSQLVNYIFSDDNKNLTLEIIFEDEDGSGEALHATVKLKKVTNWTF